MEEFGEGGGVFRNDIDLALLQGRCIQLAMGQGLHPRAVSGAPPAPSRRHTAASTPPFPLPSSSGSLHTRSRKIAAATTAAPASTDSPA